MPRKGRSNSPMESATPSQGGGAGTHLMFPASIAHPEWASVDSGYGHKFSGARSSLTYFSDNIQSVTQKLDFNVRGIWRPDGTISNSSFYGPSETFWDNVYAQLVYFTEDRVGYRHTPATLATASRMSDFITNYVKCVANVFTLVSAFSLDGWNQASITISDALRASGATRGRLQHLWATLAQIPMPEYFRQLAVHLGKVAIDRDYGLIYLKGFTWDAEYSKFYGTWTPQVLNLETDADSMLCFNKGTDAGEGDSIPELIDDIQSMTNCLLGVSGAAAGDLADFQACRQLLEILGYPKGLPQPGPAVIDPAYVDHFLYRQSFIFEDSMGLGTNRFAWFPNLTEPDASQVDVSFIRRGLGQPSPFYLTGMDGTLGYSSDTDDGTTGLVGQHDAEASVNITIYGALRQAAGGTFCSSTGDTSPGNNFAYRMYTREDGWIDVTGVADYGDVATWLAMAHIQPPTLRHQFGPLVMSSQQVTEEIRLLVDLVDFEFVQPLSTVPEIMRRQLGQIFNLPVS